MLEDCRCCHDCQANAIALIGGTTASVVSANTMLIPLLVDTDGQHSRKLWTACSREGGRTGRWGALAALGADIRAFPAGQLENFTTYREPRPLIRKQFPAGPGSNSF